MRGLWEIIPSGSVEYSMHLQVMKSPNGFYYGLYGSTYHRSKDTIHSYLAMRKAGLPVKIYDGLKMAARFEETDVIGIVPQGRSTSYLDENGEWVNCCLECPLNRMNDD